MELITLWQQSPTFFLLSVALVSAAVGSFINVVAHRLPLIMERNWRNEFAEYFGLPEVASQLDKNFSLARPASHCPHCRKPIAWYHNLPVIGYFILAGRCHHCRQAIGWRYPLVEALTLLLGVVTAWHFGVSWQSAAALVLVYFLIALTLIDLDKMLLPDELTLLLLWLGLAINYQGLFTSLESAVLGAMFGYLSLWSLYWLFKLATGKEGMGYGDFKLLAALGAWLGWQQLPLIIILSSLIGAVTGIVILTIRGQDRNIPIPFGPYLAAAGFIALLWGEEISRFYLHSTGL